MLATLITSGMVASAGEAAAVNESDAPVGEGAIASTLTYSDAPGLDVSNSAIWSVSGSLAGTVEVNTLRSGTFGFTMWGRTASGEAMGESGLIEDFDLTGVSGVSTGFRWGSYTRAGTAVYGTVVTTFTHGGQSYGPFTIEFEAHLSGVADVCPCPFDGGYVQFEGERSPTLPEGMVAGEGGSPDPSSPPSVPSWSDDKIVTRSGLPGAKYAELRWQWRRGLDRSCNPNSEGDGWFCVGPQKHGIRYTGLANPYNTTGIGTNIEDWYSYIEDGYTVNRWRQTASVGCWGEDATRCAYPSDDYWHYPGGSSNWPPPTSKWRLYETYNGGSQYHIDFNYHYIKGCTFLSYNCSSTLYTYNGPNYHWATGATTSSGLSLPDINTAGNSNLAPVVKLNTPRPGRVIHRDAPGEVEVAFTYTATDGDGHNWYGRLELRDSSGNLVESDDLSGDKQPSNKMVRVPVVLPPENDTYTWEVAATDSSGWNGAPGVTGTPKSATFDFVWNLAPDVPTLRAPLAGQPVGPTPTFALDTVDPEDDPFVGLIEIREAGNEGQEPISLETAPAASDTLAVAQLTDALEPGEYEWRARAEDVLLAGEPAESAESPWRSFTVVEAPENLAPGAPSLDAPADGAGFAHDDAVEFTITATDPEGDTYVGEVTVTDDDGNETTVITEPAASGTPSSGSAAVPLEPGHAYEWTARAIDTQGNAGPPAATSRSFTIDAPPVNEAPSTALVSPDDGHVFEPNDLQTFTVNATDPEGDAYTADVRVDGSVACTTPPTPSGDDASCTVLPPEGPGPHEWDARAVDVNDNVGERTSSRAFSVRENRDPETPSPVEPADGHTFATGDQQLFAVNATDPDGDLYHGRVVVKDGSTTVAAFDTAESPSDSPSFGAPDEPLAPGTYTWTAKAVDAAGNESGFFTPERTVTVNARPDTPALVSPPDGHTFGEDDQQTFSVSATDPDGHDYHAEVVVRDAGTNAEVTRFETAPAASGDTVSGSPPAALPPGDYTWAASALDTHGGRSDASASRSFSVAGNTQPDPPTLVTPADGGGFERDEAQVFTVTFHDPDGDSGLSEIVVDGEAVCRTPVVADGETASCEAIPPVGEGSHEWSARSGDARGGVGNYASPPRSFTVGANQAPAAPTLVAPGEGHSFAATDAQVFTINAADPEGDAYTGHVVVTRGGDEVTSFDTAPALSGEDSSGVPPTPLEPGDYRWTARAVDVRGASSGVSDEGAFSVEEPPENTGPSASLVAPGDGHEFGPSDDQVFTVSAADEEGDDWAARVAITAPDSGDLVTTFAVGPAASGDEASGSPPVALEPGDYEWSATPTDTRGAPGPTAGPQAFSVAAPPPPSTTTTSSTTTTTAPPNDAPDAPTLVAPDDGHEFGVGEAQEFRLTTTDAQGDEWFGTVTIRDDQGDVVQEFDTSSAESGGESSGMPFPPLTAGEYTWSATATDADGGTSDASVTRSFSVAAPEVENRPPAAPALVEPADGSDYGFGQPTTFTLRATDPDSDLYTGTVTVRNAGTACDGSVVETFTTRPAPSGIESSGSPSDPLPIGDYCWSATATDARGATGPSSGDAAFSVESAGASTSGDPPSLL